MSAACAPWLPGASAAQRVGAPGSQVPNLPLRTPDSQNLAPRRLEMSQWPSGRGSCGRARSPAPGTGGGCSLCVCSVGAAAVNPHPHRGWVQLGPVSQGRG